MERCFRLSSKNYKVLLALEAWGLDSQLSVSIDDRLSSFYSFPCSSTRSPVSGLRLNLAVASLPVDVILNDLSRSKSDAESKFILFRFYQTKCEPFFTLGTRLKMFMLFSWLGNCIRCAHNERSISLLTATSTNYGLFDLPVNVRSSYIVYRININHKMFV